MSKYNFGYCLESNPTNKWAFKQINPCSRVLELGPAIGALTKHLAEDINCTVDIVEIDYSSGEQAKAFANKAIIGNAGDLQKNEWYEQLAEERYDFIVALDVLEHLCDPLSVLQKARMLLKPDGRMIISVPNVAHNAVIAGLMNNRFSYTNVGLLDNTHIHFFAYSDLLKMVHDAQLHINSIDGILKPLNGTEIPVTWENVNSLQAGVLQERTYGDVYQFLLIASQQGNMGDDEIIHNFLGDGRIEDRLPTVSIVINGATEQAGVYRFKSCAMDCVFSCTSYSEVEEVRVVFSRGSMLFSDISVYARNQNGEWPLHFDWTSGVAASNGNILTVDDDECEINYKVDAPIDSIRVRVKYSRLDLHAATLLKNDISRLLDRSKQAEELRESLNGVQRERECAWKQFAVREAERDEELIKRLEAEEANRKLEAEKAELLRQLEASNADRITAWEQFANREANCNDELAKRLEAEEANRKLEAEKAELLRQLEASNADRITAWEQFANREANCNEALGRRLELEEANRRLITENEELLRRLEVSDKDCQMAWNRFTERDCQLKEANASYAKMENEMNDLQFSYRWEKQRAHQLLTKIEKLEGSVIVRYYEKVKRI